MRNRKIGKDAFKLIKNCISFSAELAEGRTKVAQIDRREQRFVLEEQKLLRNAGIAEKN